MARSGHAADVIADLGRFDTIVDARSPGEFAEDRLPGAVNWPSLDDAERATVGTEYKQVSAFDAKKRGAALVRATSPRTSSGTCSTSRATGRRSSTAGAAASAAARSRPCSTRSAFASMCSTAATAISAAPSSLRSRRCRRAFVARRLRADRIRQEPAARALAAAGAQVLDLEALANHRGSVLGLVPGSVQPSQKAFDTRSGTRCAGLDPSRPVFVESESKKIGDLRVPSADPRDARFAVPLARAGPTMRGSPCCGRLRFLRRRHRSVLRPPRRAARAARHAGRRRWQAAARPGAPPRSCATCCATTTTPSTCSRCGATSPASRRRSRP